jgi:HK97 family phage prohead protease
MTKPHVSMIQNRRASLTGKPEGRRMAAALSSDVAVPRAFGSEVLVHSEAAVDMSRAANGLALLVNHDRGGLPIGRVENIRIDDGKMRGELAFSEATTEARDAFALVEDGTLTDVSISYQIQQWERGEAKDEIRVTRWTPLEASLVSVPADGTVGIGRSIEVPETEAIAMSEEIKTPEAAPASIVDDIKARSSAGYQQGAEADRARLGDISELVAQLSRSLPDIAGDIDALAVHARGDSTITPDKFRSLAFDLIGGNAQPLALEPAPRGDVVPFRKPGNMHRGIVTAGGDAAERAGKGFELAFLERAGDKEIKPEDMAGNQYRGWSLIDCAREMLQLSGEDTRGWNSEMIAKAAIRQGQRALDPGTANYITSDFPAVTENVLTKRIHDAFNASPTTWQTWCSTTEVPDFKAFTLPRLSQISDLPVVLENDPYVDLTQTDAKETATLVKRGGLMSFSWEAIVNDDQRMFSRTAESMGESAARVLDKLAYAVLVDNGLMGDGTALFDATHGNTGVLALDLAGIVATRTLMARQTDDNSIALGIDLRYIIVPEELRDQADNLAGSEYIPWTEASPGAQRINTVRSTFTVVPTIRLVDVNNWYAASANGGTVEIAFLTGNRQPAVMREEGWNADSLNWKIRQPAVAYAVDWRGLQANIVV